MYPQIEKRFPYYSINDQTITYLRTTLKAFETITG